MEVLAVIPARGGSKGIPRKNVRLMNGKPLILYSIDNAKTCKQITDIVVTSDDEEIIGIAKMNCIDFIVRSDELAGDNVTLDPVVYDAVYKMEALKNKKYDIVITMQPTSPLLKAITLENAINYFILNNYDTVLSAVNKPHLSWSRNESGYYPNYKTRLNRQQLPPNYIETGAFFISKRLFIKPNSRMGEIISIFEVPHNESIDIDSADDWIICEKELRRKKIVFRADGYKELGMGHIFHCLTLAYNLIGHEIMFVTKEQYTDGINIIKSRHMPYKTVNDDLEFFSFLETWKPDIVVNDCLDTNKEYVTKLKTYVNKVVTIEDLGEGAKYADAVINALYYHNNIKTNIFEGEKYVCLRDEFLISKPSEFSEQVNNVVVIFGGTDPSNLTKKIYHLALKQREIYPNIKFYFITGSGYNTERNNIVTCEDKNITVLSNVKRVSDYMKIADLAFTSQGRTVYELASLGVPSIVLAQNKREQLHSFAQMQNGFLNLGLGKDISLETIEATFHWLIHAKQIRKEMRELMLAHNLKRGIDRVIDIILRED